jgi:hypothetical protein
MLHVFPHDSSFCCIKKIGIKLTQSSLHFMVQACLHLSNTPQLFPFENGKAFFRSMEATQLIELVFDEQVKKPYV